MVKLRIYSKYHENKKALDTHIKKEGDSVSDGLVLGLGFWHHLIDPD